MGKVQIVTAPSPGCAQLLVARIENPYFSVNLNAVGWRGGGMLPVKQPCCTHVLYGINLDLGFTSWIDGWGGANSRYFYPASFPSSALVLK